MFNQKEKPQITSGQSICMFMQISCNICTDSCIPSDFSFTDPVYFLTCFIGRGFLGKSNEVANRSFRRLYEHIVSFPLSRVLKQLNYDPALMLAYMASKLTGLSQLIQNVKITCSELLC